MKIIATAALTTALILVGNTVNAAPATVRNPRNPPSRFSAHEVSLDLAGSYTAAERGIEDIFETNIRNGDWGGAVGLNYFYTRNIGISGDINMSENGGNFVDIIEGSLIARFPIDSAGLAPYVFGGGGRSTEPVWEWTGHAGLGIEWRFAQTTGIFADARYIWADDSTDRLLIRAGLRVVF